MTPPILIALACGLVNGALPWLAHARGLSVLLTIITCSCGLWWVIADARTRGIGLNNWLGLGILALQPAGLLIWFIRSRGWGFYLPMLAYAGLLVLFVLLTLVGFITAGVLQGLSIGQCLDRM